MSEIRDKELLEKYNKMKSDGATAEMIYLESRNDGCEHFKGLHLLTILFELSLHEAREKAHKLIKEGRVNK